MGWMRANRTGDTRLRAKKLGHSRMVLVASPAYLAERGTPRTPDDLEGHDCLQFSFRRSVDSWAFRIGGRTVMRPLADAGPTQYGGLHHRYEVAPLIMALCEPPGSIARDWEGAIIAPCPGYGKPAGSACSSGALSSYPGSGCDGPSSTTACGSSASRS